MSIYRMPDRRTIAVLGAALLASAALGISPARADPTTLTATDVAATAGIALSTNDQYGNVVTFDYNHDGITDLLLSRHVTYGAQVYQGNADGTFTLVQTLPAGTDRHGCTSGDFNADTRPDLFCAVGAQHGTSTTKANELWLQDETGVFVLQYKALGADDGSGRGRDAEAVDVNNDGISDLFVGNAFPNQFPSPNRLFLSDGLTFTPDANLRPKAYSGGICITVGDFTEDGFADIYTCGAPDRLLINDQAGGFDERAKTIIGASTSPTGVPRASVGAQWADVNNDGHVDLVTVQSASLRIYLSVAGRLVLSYTRTLDAGRAVAVTDVDGDGFRDIYVVQGRVANKGVNQPDYLLMGDGTGTTFTDFAGLPQAATGGGSAVGVIPDYNGHPAFVVTNGGDGAKTFKGPRQLIAFSD